VTSVWDLTSRLYQETPDLAIKFCEPARPLYESGHMTDLGPNRFLPLRMRCRRDIQLRGDDRGLTHDMKRAAVTAIGGAQ